MSELTSTMLETGQNCSIYSLEKVLLDVVLSYDSRRGDITLILESPSGTVSYVMTPRPKDSNITHNKSGNINWTFTSVHFWGENIQGKWKLSLKYDLEDLLHVHNLSATLISWKLHFYGTTKAKINLHRIYHRQLNLYRKKNIEAL